YRKTKTPTKQTGRSFKFYHGLAECLKNDPWWLFCLTKTTRQMCSE
ncbi:MAG: hypothetical protein ACI91R_001848, partial [Vicingaceae bacterium]